MLLLTFYGKPCYRSKLPFSLSRVSSTFGAPSASSAASASGASTFGPSATFALIIAVSLRILSSQTYHKASAGRVGFPQRLTSSTVNPHTFTCPGLGLIPSPQRLPYSFCPKKQKAKWSCFHHVPIFYHLLPIAISFSSIQSSTSSRHSFRASLTLMAC